MEDIVDNPQCNCTLAQRLVGDGCNACNPAKGLEYAMETITDLRAENERLRGLLQAACVLLERMEDAIAVYAALLPKEHIGTHQTLANWFEVSQRIRKAFNEEN